MGKMKLTYFDLKARSEDIKLALDYCGIEFEDFKISREQLIAEQNVNFDKFPFSQIPTLTLEDGTVIAQHIAILVYIAKIGGLYSDDPLELAAIHQAMNQVEDIITLYFQYVYYARAEDKIFFYNNIKVKIPRKLDGLARVIKKFGSEGYTVGNKITIADFHVFLILVLMKEDNLYDTLIDAMCEDKQIINSVFENIMNEPRCAKRTQMYNF